MNLMTLVRLLVLVVIGWTVVSLGARALGVGVAGAPEPTFFLPRRRSRMRCRLVNPVRRVKWDTGWSIRRTARSGHWRCPMAKPGHYSASRPGATKTATSKRRADG